MAGAAGSSAGLDPGSRRAPIRQEKRGDFPGSPATGFGGRLRGHQPAVQEKSIYTESFLSSKVFPVSRFKKRAQAVPTAPAPGVYFIFFRRQELLQPEPFLPKAAQRGASFSPRFVVLGFRVKSFSRNQKSNGL